MAKVDIEFDIKNMDEVRAHIDERAKAIEAEALDDDGQRYGLAATVGRLRALKRGDWRPVVDDLGLKPRDLPPGDLAEVVAAYLVTEVVNRWAAHAIETATPVVAAALRGLAGVAAAELAEWAGRE